MIDYAAAIVTWSGGTTTLLGLTKILNGIQAGDTSRDEEISLYLDMAGTACENYIDNKIVSQEVTELFAKSHAPIALRYWPAGEVTNVTIDGDDKTEDYETYTTDGIHYEVKDTCGESWNTCFDQMSITYTAGYDPIPSDLAFVLARTGLAYGNQSGGAGSVKKESIVGVGSIEYQTIDDAEASVGAISSSSAAVLDSYRRYHV